MSLIGPEWDYAPDAIGSRSGAIPVFHTGAVGNERFLRNLIWPPTIELCNPLVANICSAMR